MFTSGPVFLPMLGGGWSTEALRVEHTTDGTDAARCLERKAAGGKQKRNRRYGARGTLRRRLHELPKETRKLSQAWGEQWELPRLPDVWLVTIICT